MASRARLSCGLSAGCSMCWGTLARSLIVMSLEATLSAFYQCLEIGFPVVSYGNLLAEEGKRMVRTISQSFHVIG